MLHVTLLPQEKAERTAGQLETLQREVQQLSVAQVRSLSSAPCLALSSGATQRQAVLLCTVSVHPVKLLHRLPWRSPPASLPLGRQMDAARWTDNMVASAHSCQLVQSALCSSTQCLPQMVQDALARQNEALERAVQLPQAAANGAAAVEAAVERRQDAAQEQSSPVPDRKLAGLTPAPWWLDTEAQVKIRAWLVVLLWTTVTLERLS